MENTFKQNSIIRQNAINLISRFSDEKSHLIPTGFNNNLIWNFGHMIVTQHVLTFGLGNIPFLIDNETIGSFKKGSNPTENNSKKSIKELIEISNFLIIETQKAYNQKSFGNFKKYETSFGVTLNNIDEAIGFNNIHEGLHLGYMMALSKSL